MIITEKRYKLIIFDVDGTLLDTSEGLIQSTIYTIRKMGYKMPSQEMLLSFAGPRIQDSFQRVYGLKGEELNKAAAVFRNHYKEGDVLLAKPYNGVYEVLEYLKSKGKCMAIATNKRQDFVEQLMHKYNFAPYIQTVYGTDFEGKLEKADLIYRCMQEFPKFLPNEAVMIGDSSYDAIAAEKLKIDFIGVTYGYEFKNSKDINKWSNVGYVDYIRELKDLII